MKNPEKPSQPEPENSGVNSVYWSDRGATARNKKRFSELGFNLDNLDFYKKDLHSGYGLAEPFAEVINIDESVLSSSDARVKDFIISHEIVHYLISQKLPRDFFEKHPELTDKKRKLIEKRKAEDIGLPPLMKEDFLKKLIFEYAGGNDELITHSKALEVLEKFTRDFQGFKPMSTNYDYFKRAAELALNVPIFLGRTEPYKSEDEYESQAVTVLLQLGEKLLKEIQIADEQKCGFKSKEGHFIEEGACNYLAAKLLGVPLDEIPFKNIDGLATSKIWERKLNGDTSRLVESIKKGDSSFLRLYKTLD